MHIRYIQCKLQHILTTRVVFWLPWNSLCKVKFPIHAEVPLSIPYWAHVYCMLSCECIALFFHLQICAEVALLEDMRCWFACLLYIGKIGKILFANSIVQNCVTAYLAENFILHICALEIALRISLNLDLHDYSLNFLLKWRLTAVLLNRYANMHLQLVVWCDLCALHISAFIIVLRACDTAKYEQSRQTES